MGKQGRGRPAIYANDEERKAARAKAARERRAAMKAEGLKEIRRVVKSRSNDKLESSIIDLSVIYNNKRF